MGTSTVSGPFRSQNGFQELVNGVWTPVGGGGGGGGGGGYVFTNVSNGQLGTDNRYSNNPNSLSGPTAGTVVTLPLVDVGQTIVVFGLAGSGGDVWKIKLPTAPGTDTQIFYPIILISGEAGSGGGPLFVEDILGGSNTSTDEFFLYSPPVSPLHILRTQNVTIPPEFGGPATFAIYQVVNPLTGLDSIGSTAPYNVNVFPRVEFAS
jgi:hypothetical protein